jgi:hypothetical protein
LEHTISVDHVSQKKNGYPAAVLEFLAKDNQLGILNIEE